MSTGTGETTQVNLYEAKTHLSSLVDRAAAGEEVVIAKAGKPLARLVAVEQRRQPRTYGLMRGEGWLGSGWDDDLTDQFEDL